MLYPLSYRGSLVDCSAQHAKRNMRTLLAKQQMAIIHHGVVYAL
ncbi:hypothetical protein CGSMWGv00703C2mash_02711 [Gardnerella pickettii 00703C2mash]|nr:hypothetical protein CGSMWGv00703C2mash_02711 [Gardnerella pickettii 00703C2mash]